MIDLIGLVVLFVLSAACLWAILYRWFNVPGRVPYAPQVLRGLVIVSAVWMLAPLADWRRVALWWLAAILWLAFREQGRGGLWLLWLGRAATVAVLIEAALIWPARAGFGNPNMAAALLLLCYPWVITWRGPGVGRRWVWMVLCGVALAATRSRAVLVGFMVISVIDLLSLSVDAQLSAVDGLLIWAAALAMVGLSWPVSFFSL